MDLNSLPNEVLENIFMFLDGQSLVHVSMVCPKYYHVIKNLEKNIPLWRKVCSCEIPRHTLEELLGRRFYKSDIDVKWKEIYIAWFRGHLIKSHNYDKVIITVPKDPITCVKISGDYIITSHRSGLIQTWVNSQFHHVITKHSNLVTDFILIDNLHLGEYCPRINTWNHMNIVSVSKDHTLQVNFLLFEGQNLNGDISKYCYNYFHGAALEFVREFNGIVAAYAADSTIILFEVILQDQHAMKLSLLRNFHIPSSFTHAFMFWHDDVHYYCFNQAFTLSKIPVVDIKIQSSSYYMKSNLLKDQVDVSHVFIFRKNIVFSFTNYGKLFININSGCIRECNYMPYTMSPVLSMALKGSVLAMGTEAGRLLLYHVPLEEDILNLGVPVFCNNLSEASIISIDIADNGGIPAVIACTTEQIFYIKWFHKPFVEL